MRTNLVLIGFMGSGKSSIGRLVAQRLGFRFLDTDGLIVERFRMEIAEIFAQQGEEAFRDLESGALESLAQEQRCVISTGGGIILREKNRTRLRELGLVIWLTASEDVIYERVARNTRRPLLQTDNPRETIAQLLAARRPLYEQAAEVTIDSTQLTREQAADAVIAEARRTLSWETVA